MSINYKQRYQQAHEANFAITYPKAYTAGHYCPPKFPKVNTANGLTTFIINYLLWQSWRATRIAASGRLIDAPEKQKSGTVLIQKKWIPGATRKGSADISSTIKGRSVMWEVKMNDKPSEHQLKEQELERRAGGEYFFTHSPDEFFAQLDSLFILRTEQT